MAYGCAARRPARSTPDVAARGIDAADPAAGEVDVPDGVIGRDAMRRVRAFGARRGDLAQLELAGSTAATRLVPNRLTQAGPSSRRRCRRAARSVAVLTQLDLAGFHGEPADEAAVLHGEPDVARPSNAACAGRARRVRHHDDAGLARPGSSRPMRPLPLPAYQTPPSSGDDEVVRQRAFLDLEAAERSVAGSNTPM
jgi:hypothetical protein